MSLHLALVIVVLVAIIGNRIFALLAGLILYVPASILLPMVCVIDFVQIPFFYWVYENGATLLERLPKSIRSWFGKGPGEHAVGRWTSSIGGLGVFLIAALPAFGGGMWSAVFLAHSLRLRKLTSYLLIMLGSLISYLSLFWVLDTLVRTVRYFSR